ncbi:MAG: tetratricopeptide repeat protein, partial [Gemmatimonadota bacterium]
MRRNRVVTAALALLLLGLSAPLLAQETAEELYQAALYQEEVQGNLERALDQFARILVRFPESRAVGARAQLHIGLCYEKLGQQEARQAFRKVIEDFPEHAAEVALARDRLAEIDRALAERNHQPVFRKVEIPSRPQNGVLSPSGDSLAFVSQGSLWVVPLSSGVGAHVPGEPLVLAEDIGAWDVSNLLSWSADGMWIAVNSETPDPEGSIHVVPVEGGQSRLVRRPPSGGHAYSYRLGLSPDGGTVAFTALEPGWSEGAEARVWERVVYVAPTTGGESRQLTVDWGRTPAISPDGELVAFVGFRERGDLSESETGAMYDGDLWVVPSAGGKPVRLATVDGRLAGPVWSPDGRSIAARYEGGDGNETTEIRVYRLSSDRSSAEDPV